MSPSDPGIDRELTLIDWQWDQRKKKEKKIFVNLFDEEKQEEVEKKLQASKEAAAAPRHPVQFKEDVAKLKKTDHVSLPGEDAMLDKWGGAVKGDLPRGENFLEMIQKWYPIEPVLGTSSQLNS